MQKEEKKTAWAVKHPLHRLRKRRHIGPKYLVSTPTGLQNLRGDALMSDCGLLPFLAAKTG